MLWIGSVASGGALYAGYRALRSRRVKRRKLVDKLYLDAPQNQPPTALVKQPIVQIQLWNPYADEEEANTQTMLLVSCASVGVAVLTGLAAPALTFITTPLVVFASIDVIEDALRGIFAERRARIAIVDSVAIIGTLATGFYFPAALTTALYWVGRDLLLRTEDRAERNLINIFGERPRVVYRLITDGETGAPLEIETPFESLEVGHHLVIRAGETVATDGLIVEGLATIDQHMLTGESQPVEKNVGDEVLAATLVVTGKIVVEVLRTGEQTVAAQIGEILQQTADYRATLEARSSQLADRSTTPTLGLSALVATALGPIVGLSVLMSNFSEILRIVAPLGMLNYLSLASKGGILIKDGRALEQLNDVSVIIFDKTGTLTLEQPHVANIVPLNGYTVAEVLHVAATAEYRQTHPIAQAILQAARDAGIDAPVPDDAHIELGFGVRVQVGDHTLCVGSQRFMQQEQVFVPDAMQPIQQACHERGDTLIYVAVDDELIGGIELHTTIRPEVPHVVDELHKRGLVLYMISGDHEYPTRYLAQNLNIDHYFAEVLPQEKADIVRQLQAQGHKVCFVGDGINDSIALKQADVSISISGATNIAIDTAAIIMMDGTLGQLTYALDLAKQYRVNLRNSIALTATTSLFSIGGVFFLRFRILSTVVIYNLNLMGSVANAMWPALQDKMQSSRLEDAPLMVDTAQAIPDESHTMKQIPERTE